MELWVTIVWLRCWPRQSRQVQQVLVRLRTCLLPTDAVAKENEPCHIAVVKALKTGTCPLILGADIHAQPAYCVHVDMQQLSAKTAMSGTYLSLATKSSTYAPNARTLDTWNTSALSTRAYTQRCSPPKEQLNLQHRRQLDTSSRTKWDSWRTVSLVSKVPSKSLGLLMRRAQTPSLASS